MTNYLDLEALFSAVLGLARRPVAVASVQQIPTGLTKFEGSVPSGCTFWRLAAEGRTFYTVPSDHYNCSIGCHTHNIPLPSERQAELTGTLGLMVDIGYLRMEEVPGIPRLPVTPVAIIYAPLGDTPVEPDVVLFAGPAGRVMLLQEAAIRAGVAAQVTTLGRPTCMAVPAAMALGMVASTGCVGNRVYTEVLDGDLYAVIPREALSKVAAEITTISEANTRLLEYHGQRRQQLLSI